jgi:hypothetical protein
MMKVFPFATGYKRFNPVPELDCRDAKSINANIINYYLKSL